MIVEEFLRRIGTKTCIRSRTDLRINTAKITLTPPVYTSPRGVALQTVAILGVLQVVRSRESPFVICDIFLTTSSFVIDNSFTLFDLCMSGLISFQTGTVLLRIIGE